MFVRYVIFIGLVMVVTAIPTSYDPVITKLDPDGLRYTYLQDDEGNLHLVDSWVKASDFNTRYNPDIDNQYHLFTRKNPTISQPIVENNNNTLLSSDYDPSKRTVVLIHGFMGHILNGFNSVLVPAFLEADDVNIIVVDWGAGAHFGLYGISSGRSVGRVLGWIMSVTGSNPEHFHLLGYSVGAHQAGIAGRVLNGQCGYITAMDPSDRWLSSQFLTPTDSLYTEVIHTNAGDTGTERPCGHVDFYPNGGRTQPGCITNVCAHYRSYFFYAESLTSGGFTGIECGNHEDALAQRCDGSRRLRMGGLLPKTGSSGIYYLTTNPAPPFSQG